jgi:hypothetical protein
LKLLYGGEGQLRERSYHYLLFISEDGHYKIGDEQFYIKKGYFFINFYGAEVAKT